MRPLPRLLIVTAVLALALSGPVSAANAATIFADEFRSGPLNSTLWKTVLPWGTQWNNREQQWYDPANLLFVNGELQMLTKQGYDNGYPYSSGIVTSRNQQSYGYFETRARLPKGQGVWPAFWLLNDGTQEIDIFELLGNTPNKIYMTYHRSGYGQVYQSTYTLSSGDFSQAYHTFGVDVQPSYIRWYVDGVKRGEYYTSVPSNTGNIILNTAVGDSTSWPGAPNSSTAFPQYFDIDYVRVHPTLADATPAPPPVNAAPVANADAYSTNEDRALSVAAPGVLGNDRDAENSLLTASLVSQPAHGTLAFNSNGSFIYTPSAGYAGSDSFSYQASDGSLKSGVTSVQLTVNAVNYAPAASADSFSIDQDFKLSIAAPGLLVNDSDPDGDALTAQLVGQPVHGTVALSADGSFVYMPDAGFAGSDAFTYAASDGALKSAPAAVTLNVVPTPTDPGTTDPGTGTVDPGTAPPAGTAPGATTDAYRTRQGVPLTVSVPGVLGNDTDADGDPLTAALVTQPAHGTISLAANGSFVYTPASGWYGTDSFGYRASDGTHLSGSTLVTIDVLKQRGRPHWRSWTSARSGKTTNTYATGSVGTGGWSRAISDLMLRTWGYLKHRFQ